MTAANLNSAMTVFPSALSAYLTLRFPTQLTLKPFRRIKVLTKTWNHLAELSLELRIVGRMGGFFDQAHRFIVHRHLIPDIGTIKFLAREGPQSVHRLLMR